MQKSEQINELATALAKAQTELENVSKNKKNDFSGWKYADLPVILEYIKPVLSGHGLSFSQLVGSSGAQIELTTILMHISGQYLSSCVAFDVEPKKGNSLAQAAGATITYFRRYSLTALIGIAADDDTDGASSGKGIPIKTELPTNNTKYNQNVPQAAAKKDVVDRIELLWEEQYDESKRSGIMKDWLSVFKVKSLSDLPNDKALHLLGRLEDNKKKREIAHV